MIVVLATVIAIVAIGSAIGALVLWGTHEWRAERLAGAGHEPGPVAGDGMVWWRKLWLGGHAQPVCAGGGEAFRIWANYRVRTALAA